MPTPPFWGSRGRRFKSGRPDRSEGRWSNTAPQQPRRPHLALGLAWWRPRADQPHGLEQVRRRRAALGRHPCRRKHRQPPLHPVVSWDELNRARFICWLCTSQPEDELPLRFHPLGRCARVRRQRRRLRHHHRARDPGHLTAPAVPQATAVQEACARLLSGWSSCPSRTSCTYRTKFRILG